MCIRDRGMSAHSRSADGKFTGHVVAVQREYVDGRYNAKFISGPAENFANHVKHVPVEWILPDYQGLTQEFYDYITPLIQGEPTPVSYTHLTIWILIRSSGWRDM